MTVITNLLLFVSLGYWGYLLLKHKKDFAWVGVYFCGSVGALFGAIAHGFGTQLSLSFEWWVWKIVLNSIILGSYFLGLAYLNLFFHNSKYLNFFKKALLFKWFVFLILSFQIHAFFIVVVDYSITNLFVLISSVISYYKTRQKFYLKMILGFVLIFLASFVQVFKLAPSQYFNHNDLYHVILFVAFYILCQALSCDFHFLVLQSNTKK